MRTSLNGIIMHERRNVAEARVGLSVGICLLSYCFSFCVDIIMFRVRVVQTLAILFVYWLSPMLSSVRPFARDPLVVSAIY